MEKEVLEKRKKVIYDFICDDLYVPMKARARATGNLISASLNLDATIKRVDKGVTVTGGITDGGGTNGGGSNGGGSNPSGGSSTGDNTSGGTGKGDSGTTGGGGSDGDSTDVTI